MTNYQSDDKEHNFGRFRVKLGDVVVTRYWKRENADNKVAALRLKVYGRNAEVEDGGE